MRPSATPSSGRATPVLVFAVLAVGIGLSAWLYIRGVQRDVKAGVARELSSIADFKVEQLVAWREGQARDWAEFRTNRFVRDALRSALRHGDAGLLGEVGRVVRLKRTRTRATAAFVLDGRGAVVVADPADARPSARELEVARRALDAPEPLLDEGAAGDDVAVVVSTGEGPDERAAVVARYDTTVALSAMVLSWPHPASTAEPVLVRRDGDYIVPVTHPLHTKAPRLPLSLDIPTTRAVKGTTGIVECDDYRGVPIIAALRQVPGSSWYLSVKIDRAEVFAPGRRQAVAFGVVTLVLLTAAGVGVWFWWRAQDAAIRRRGDALEKEALRRRFDALWAQANDVVIVMDPGGRLLEANERGLHAYGYSRDELRQLRIEDLRASDTREIASGQLARVLADGATRFETVHRRKDGATFPVEVSASSIVSPSGPLVLSVIRDITERRAAEAASRYQATLLENLNDAVIGLDRAARITAWEGAATRLYGYAPGEALGRRISELLGGDLPEETSEAIAGEIERTGRCRTEVRHARKDGRLLEIEVTAVAIRDGAGEVAGFVAVHRDVGDRKRAEAEQRRLHQELVFADRLASIGVLAAGVAHEINNPLSFLVANLEYLRQAGDGADRERSEALHEAAEGARRIAEIVRGLKAFGRRDAGSPPGPVDLRRAVTAAIHMVQAQARPRARLVTDLAETPPVLGREHEVAQVVLNLVINAIQAVPEGRPGENEVRVSTRAAEDVVEVAVHDTGAGIAPENLDRIYDPFFTTKEVGEGSGLGLSICLGLVRAMRGTIDVESTVGRGTTFTVRLPVAPVVDAPPRHRARPTPRRGRILVLDDEPMVCAAVKRSLEPDHEVVTLCDPRVAAERLSGGEWYDVVLCDLLMPHVTGMELFDTLRDHRPEIARRMLFLTGGAFTSRGRAFMDHHRARCVEKPFEPEQLRARVAEALARLATAEA